MSETDTHSTQELANLYNDSFRPLNNMFKEICYKWQVTPRGDINDHSDKSYDFQVLDLLDELHVKMEKLSPRLVTSAPDSVSYLDRLRVAKEKIDQGNFKFVTGIGTDSYHEIWMALHEFLLKEIGKESREEDEI